MGARGGVQWGEYKAGEYNGGSTMGEYKGGVQWGSTMGGVQRGGVQWGEHNGGSSCKQISSPSYGRRHFVQSKFPKGDHLAKEKR